jgi:hypothetical protein
VKKLDAHGIGRRWGISTVVACAALSLLLAGCSNLPGMPTSSSVQTVVERGPFLDVQITQGGKPRRYFTPQSEPCRSLLEPEAPIDYVALGPLGQLQSGEVVCVPVGIGTLAAWRDQRPRPMVGPLPARQADYRVEYQDQDLAMLRGRFPLLGLIAWPGLGDTLVVIPKTPACQPLMDRGTATIEYRVAGPDPYVLLSGDQRCPVQGLIQPVGEPAP